MFSYGQNSYLFLPLNRSQWFQWLSGTEHELRNLCSVLFSPNLWLKCHGNGQTCEQALQAFWAAWAGLGSWVAVCAACRAFCAVAFSPKITIQ